MAEPKILFCGQMKSPFISQDHELLSTQYDVELIDLDFLRASIDSAIAYGYFIISSMIPKVYRTDVVYIWFADYPALPIIVLAKLFDKKIITTVGGWEVANYPEISYGNQLRLIRGAVTRWCIRNSDVVLTPSESYKNITLGIEPYANVMVISNAIKSELFTTPLPQKCDRVITALFTISDTSVLKGLPTFEAAVSRLPYECKVYEAIPHEDLMDIFRKSKVYCQLSYTESFGVTNLEAMACGCVPVVTNRDALPEIVGDTGVVVPYGNVDATIEAIKKAMTMDGNKARERAKLFTRERRMGELSKMINELVEPLVSVVIPAYNSEKWLTETIFSITNQTHKNIEIIVVDDCSTDNTEGLVKSFRNKQIKYIKNEVNKGECISSRVGFAHAKGDFICRLSSDDVWVNKDKVKNQVKLMQKTGADWSYNSINCTGISVTDNKRVDSYWLSIPTRFGQNISSLLQMFDNTILRFPRLAFVFMVVRGNPVNSSTLMFKRDSYFNNEQWSDKHRTDCDGLLIYKSLLKGLRGIAVKEMGALYRIHPEQMSYNPKYLAESKLIKSNIIEEVINKNHPLWLKIVMRLVRRFKK
jgi:glycosyltransferase involved in cell wall biosynthesis